jgi:hypothetical protein
MSCLSLPRNQQTLSNKLCSKDVVQQQTNVVVDEAFKITNDEFKKLFLLLLSQPVV